MRKSILIASDLQGTIPVIPDTLISKGIDILILSGNICPNFTINYTAKKLTNKAREIEMQQKWIDSILRKWIDYIGPLDTVICPGNHDFVDFPILGFDNSATQGCQTEFQLNGVNIGIIPGVLPIKSDFTLESNEDQVEEDELWRRLTGLTPDLEVLVTHTPPFNILSRTLSSDPRTDIGSVALAKVLFGSKTEKPYFDRLRLACFGHTHQNGLLHHQFENKRDLILANTAKTFSYLELDNFMF